MPQIVEEIVVHGLKRYKKINGKQRNKNESKKELYEHYQMFHSNDKNDIITSPLQ